MSGSGVSHLTVDAHGLRVALVAASWHQEVMRGLRDGAHRAAALAGAQVEEVTVAGSFELPVVAAECAKTGRFEAIVALGVVIRGGTPHFDYVCSAATEGLSRVALDHGIPVGFGVLTCDTEQQALDRSGLPGAQEDKGAEAMASALHTAVLLRSVRASRP
jgi:6,7-dimethyl-8-ribityllumazine synthase